MKNKKYTPMKTGVLFVASIICLSILGGAIFFGGVFLSATGGDINSLVENKSYLESKTMKKELTNECNELIYFVVLKEELETEGKFDDNKLINILDINSKNIGLHYKIKDLLEWSQKSKGYKEWINTISEVEITEQAEKGFEEFANPEGYKNVLEFAEANGYNVDDVYSALANAIDIISVKVEEYYNYKDQYNPEKTNFIYEAKNIKTGEVFKNDTLDKAKDAVVVLEEIGSDYNIKVGINNDLLVKDNWYYASRNYNDLMPYKEVLFSAVIIGLLGSIITIVWLTVLSGHSRKKEGITLYFIDRIPTELALLGWGIIAACVVVMLSGLTKVMWNMEDIIVVWEIVLVIVCCAVAATVYMVGYLSFVRILKAKVFWKNSICYKLLHGVKEIFKYAKITGRVLVTFGVYLLINAFLSLYYLVGGMGILLAFVFNCFVAYIIYRDALMRQQVLDGIKIIADGNLEYQIPVEEIKGTNQELAEAINTIGNGLHNAVEASIKNERTKTDLITNVSHDIKTPLTSIINYVDLLKRENIQDEKIKGYIDVLERKSQRLKQLTEDLVEASKVSSGNITLEMMNMDFNELLQQTIGEFGDKFIKRELELVINHPGIPVVIKADGKRLWRILENIFGNAVKYAMPHTRVYVDLTMDDMNMIFSVKNISEHALNISADELTERFIRGDIARSTEGSGLGLSIAKNLVALQQGEFDVYLDGDLFKVTVTFEIQK